jgi:hypothetical protein
MQNLIEEEKEEDTGFELLTEEEIAAVIFV